MFSWSFGYYTKQVFFLQNKSVTCMREVCKRFLRKKKDKGSFKLFCILSPTKPMHSNFDDYMYFEVNFYQNNVI